MAGCFLENQVHDNADDQGAGQNHPQQCCAPTAFLGRSGTRARATPATVFPRHAGFGLFPRASARERPYQFAKSGLIAGAGSQTGHGDLDLTGSDGRASDTDTAAATGRATAFINTRPAVAGVCSA
jgi:hypothetical protein